MENYKHISFYKRWKITPDCSFILGECNAFIHALSNTPLKPEYRNKLLEVSLIKGAQATTAIEGNTLSQEEIEKINEGWKLPPSREYQEIEVKNVIEAFNTLLREIVSENKTNILTPDLIKKFHYMVTKNLGNHSDAIPGKYRCDSRVVGTYLAPAHKHVPELIENLCSWLKKEFHYEKSQHFKTAVVQAIITHVYLEWIHPFADGNGRTGRLLEFYILLRAGLPSIVSHILSNFYNQTRPEYYRQLDNAIKKNDLTDFIEYAVLGFRDGLNENLKIIQEGHFIIFWENYIYEKFSKIKYTKKNAFKRKRELMLKMPIDRELSLNEILELTPSIVKKYATLKQTTLVRDIKELQALNLLQKIGKKYRPNTDILKAMIPS
ncbi:MAG: Fic family protein [Desulfobacterales bacterium]|nr:Fic family protein [Desulfobacterales bacterium]MDD4073556.1 Fic family protein [Desulfobacterales bacterium]MDD4392030.1 Fic family protein [Desulfobacterales bacterium]